MRQVLPTLRMSIRKFDPQDVVWFATNFILYKCNGYIVNTDQVIELEIIKSSTIHRKVS
jgi:hypothetical protein